MLWFILFLIVVVVAIVVATANSFTEKPGHTHRRYVIRDGKSKQADTVFDAWTSGDLSFMLAQLDKKTTLVDRHFLLMNIVGATYKQRHSAEMRATCCRIARMHIAEFPRIKPALKRSVGVLPRVPTFHQYATILTEDGKFEEAIAVCESALGFGLSDGTQSGFEGRIERIKKKQKRVQKQTDD